MIVAVPKPMSVWNMATIAYPKSSHDTLSDVIIIHAIPLLGVLLIYTIKVKHQLFHMINGDFTQADTYTDKTGLQPICICVGVGVGVGHCEQFCIL